MKKACRFLVGQLVQMPTVIGSKNLIFKKLCYVKDKEKNTWSAVHGYLLNRAYVTWRLT